MKHQWRLPHKYAYKLKVKWCHFFHQKLVKPKSYHLYHSWQPWCMCVCVRTCTCICKCAVCWPSFVPRPPPFVLWFSFSIIPTSVYYTERKPKNKKRGRPGNKASVDQYKLCAHKLQKEAHILVLIALCPVIYLTSCGIALLRTASAYTTEAQYI